MKSAAASDKTRHDDASPVREGARGRTRTSDTRFRKPVLYPLSYAGAGTKGTAPVFRHLDELRHCGAPLSSRPSRWVHAEMGRKGSSGQLGKPPEEGDALLGVNESELGLGRRGGLRTNSLQRIYLWQSRVPVGNRVPYAQPFIDPPVCVYWRAGDHSNALSTSLAPRPMGTRVKARAYHQPAGVLGIRRREVSDLLPHATSENRVGGRRERTPRPWRAYVHARQRVVLDDGLPACHRKDDDCAVDRHLFVPATWIWPAVTTMDSDEVVAMNHGAAKVLHGLVDVHWLARLLPGLD